MPASRFRPGRIWKGVHVDRQQGKPSRPSLISGAENRSAEPLPTGRILADMESRKERPAAPAPRRRGKPFALIFGLVAVFVASGYLLLRSQDEPFDSGPTVASADKPAAASAAATRPAAVATPPPAPSASTVPAPAMPAPALPATGTAAIVEPAKIVLDDDNPFDPGEPAAKPAAKTAADAPRQVASATPPKAGAKPPLATARAAPAAGKRRGEAKKNDDGLMAVLLGNIDTDAESGGKRKAKARNRNAKEDQDALEQLIRKVNADSAAEAKKNAAASAAAAKSATAAGKAAAKPVAGTNAKSATKPAKAAESATPAAPANPVQASLRKCPKANTARGLQCRQKICAKYAGQDPACPAQ
ncbi:hypothetical protein [Lysobacter sp. yr284]|uniref:hypothetical protein n=1 Tax=Lysobacter sp. yr284 TaxID=1761791 RepID=UPI00111330FC|nr:hypothetical protein [Lysobacter sp. yr284]